MKYPWQCKYAGCDASKASNAKYCQRHADEMAARVGAAVTRLPKRDTATSDLFAPEPERLPPTPAAQGQDTSDAAGHSVQHKARGQAIVLLRLINARGYTGLTCDELEVVTGWPHQTVSGRLWQMEKRGWLERTGVQRPTRSGSQAKAYTLTERGRDQLAAQAREFARERAP
jgi:hypothetical protein